MRFPSTTFLAIEGEPDVGELVAQVRRRRELEQQARWLLDHIGIRPGSRAIDIGCGPIGILNLLSERVGPQGAVIGLEYVPRFAEMARNDIARRRLINVEVTQTDALLNGLQRNSFDFVHERLVMINIPTPETILSEMIALVRPGGTVAVEEVDGASWLCHRQDNAALMLISAMPPSCRGW